MEPDLSYRPGYQPIAALPTKGPWMLAAAMINGVETIIACAPDHPPLFFRDGKQVELFPVPAPDALSP